MNINYGNSKTYQYELNQEDLNWLIERTNRSKGQTVFLYQLVDGDFDKLKHLEKQIKNSFYMCCPDNKDDVENILSKKIKKEWFSI